MNYIFKTDNHFPRHPTPLPFVRGDGERLLGFRHSESGWQPRQFFGS